MRARLAGLASIALASVLVHCSLVVDTDGLAGGATEAGIRGDGPTNGEGGLAEGSSLFDGPVAPGAFGGVWLAYGNGAGKVAIRTWTGDAWSAELAGPNVDGEAVRWVVAKETPVGSFLGIVSQTSSASRLQIFQRGPDGAWRLGFAQPMTVSGRRAFDVEYETTSKGIVVVYGDSTAHVKARRLAAGAWSAEMDVGPGGELAPQWLELARHPSTDEIALVYADDGNNLFSTYWDGSKWQKPDFLEGHLNTIDWKCFDQAYENSTGKLVVAWGQNTPLSGGGEDHSMRFAFRQPGAPVFGATQSTAAGSPPGSLVMVPEVGTKRIALSYVEYNCNRGGEPCDDFAGMIWDGTQFAVATIDADTTTLYRDLPSAALTSVAWIGGTGNAVAAYHRTIKAVSGQLAYSRYGGRWSDPKGASAPPPMEPRVSMQLASLPGSKVVALVEDQTGALWSKLYAETADGNGSWSDPASAPLATALVPTNGVPFSVAEP